MQCAVCGKTTREKRDGLCFRCYVLDHSIRLEPELPYLNTALDAKLAPQREYGRFNLKAFISDVRVDARNDRYNTNAEFNHKDPKNMKNKIVEPHVQEEHIAFDYLVNHTTL